MEQIKSLESQLQEDQIRRDEVERQSASKGAQYVDIMAMALKVQGQGDLDMQEWKAEKKEWQQEKQALCQWLVIVRYEMEALSQVRRDVDPAEARTRGEGTGQA